MRPLVLSFLLFFECARAHRALPSFPTRRSSDLDWNLPLAAEPLFSRGYMGDGFIDFPAITKMVAASGYSGEDRKSTRLNSSHVAISYAVFCLKKKKKRAEYDTDIVLQGRVDAWW